MAFSNEDILSWFCATNPLPEKTPDNIDHLPPPGHTKFTHKTNSEQRKLLEQKQKGLGNASQSIPQGVGGGTQYQRFASLQQSLQNYPDFPQYNLYDFDNADDYLVDTTSDPPSDAAGSCYQAEMMDAFYSKYSFDENYNPELPIANHRERIVSTIEANQVTIIQGSTGSGKSTQVPQYILDHYVQERKHCNIVCTQPRRIAATSVAKFVSESRGWQLGTLVGYQISLDKVATEDTRVMFMTTGVLLEQLVHTKNMNQYTHVILDEVHERDCTTDLGLLVVRKLLRTNSKHVKVILMSATFETDIFALYFAVRISGRMELAPVVAVEGRSFPVTEFYLDDIRDIAECQPMNLENPRISEDTMRLACMLIKNFDKIERQDPCYGKGDFIRGTVLVFLPGLPEIMELEESRLMSQLRVELGLTVIPLHSSISGEQQYKVFLKPEIGKRKVILATNIAESSITVPDIKYVIDFCLVKHMTYDQESNYTCLQTVWASRASLTQRKGRAGRVSAGRCYRLITRDFFRRYIPEYSVPEMLRTSLESSVLKAKQLGMGEPRAVLGHALEPPNLTDIERAILNLKEVGALAVMQDGVANPYDGNLTFVGVVLESLPLDVKVGKLLVLGHAFGCLEECLVIAAALSNKSFFARPFKSEMKAYKSKMGWSDNTFSDCIAILAAYTEWFKQKNRVQLLGKDKLRAEQHWCSRNLIHKNTINEVAESVRDLERRLARFNIKCYRKLTSRDNEMAHHDMLILKLVLCGAFYPNYFRWSMSNEEMNQKEMSGYDPSTTVVLSGLPPNPERYAREIMMMLAECGEGKYLHFEGSKVFVEFHRPRPSRTRPVEAVQPVLDAVYVALKRRQSRQPLELYVDTRDRGRHSRRQSDRVMVVEDELKPIKLPRTGFHQIIVTEILDAGHFWAQFADRETTADLQYLMESINNRPLTPLTLHPKKMPGQYCLAKYAEDDRYYRAKIIAVLPQSTPVNACRAPCTPENPCVRCSSLRTHALSQVVFVDYGNVEVVPLDCLCEMPQEYFQPPMQAFECFLASVKPAYSHSSAEGCWSTEAILAFRDLCGDKYLMCNVYSQVGGVLRVELWDTTGPGDILINEELVKKGYALRCEEPYMSKFARAQALSMEQAEAQAAMKRMMEGREDEEEEEEQGERVVEVPRRDMTTTIEWGSNYADSHRSEPARKGTRVVLRGPSSPYEIHFYAMTNVGGMRPARIERDSVNSIVVDNEPQDKHERMMVAAHVALNPSRSACVAKETTLLPNIHGLIHLVCLLFAPTIEIRTDELKRQYTGAICGLGFDPCTGQSLYHEHDIEITFDTLITEKDLEKINQVRMAINYAIGAVDDDVAQWGQHTIQTIQTKARKKLWDLILKQRDSVPPFHSTKRGWNQVSPDDILLSSKELEEELDSTPMYPLHTGVAVSGERIDQQRTTRVLLLREKMRELHKKASKSTEPMTLVCELCNVRCGTPGELLAHLSTRLHMASEKQLFLDDPNLDLTAEQLSQMGM